MIVRNANRRRKKNQSIFEVQREKMKEKVFIVITLMFMASVLADYHEIETQVVNGTDAEISEFPFMVSLRRNDLHTCGATILNSWWLLTVRNHNIS